MAGLSIPRLTFDYQKFLSFKVPDDLCSLVLCKSSQKLNYLAPTRSARR